MEFNTRAKYTFYKKICNFMIRNCKSVKVYFSWNGYDGL